MHLDIEQLRSWIGKTESRSDVVTAVPALMLSALLDRDDPPQFGDALPPLWHWLYFLPIARQSEFGRDGHPARGGFLPPVPLARRMWAGSRLQFHRPLRVGEPITRVSRIDDVSLKAGRSGPLVFVRVHHEISSRGEPAIVEEHDIVYRDAPGAQESPAAPKPAPAQHSWRREIRPDPVLLFRYSALTLNGHRIHYDRPYATDVEGYPGLVVHGPLLATLLLDLLRRNLPAAEVSRFSFRARRPLYDTAPFYIYGMRQADGTSVALWTRDSEGRVTIEAEARLL
ncbi:MAG TPA: MaoC family dehydratase N-terminal domain-containing protein [Burkholderiales bacterium]|nr:MaoC family dehydratase N-terminal domain-containing protein [Burkholderiales bacterium]